MAAPNPLATFNAINDDRGYGGILLLDWTYPTVLPTTWKLYIFKKQGSAVSSQQITDYFAGSLTATQIKQLGIFVYDNLPASATFLNLKDFVVDNGKVYYYKALIRDTTTNENSTISEDNGTPESSIYMRVIDAKDIIAKALEKTLQATKTTRGYHPELEKDIRVFKSHGERESQDNFFVVSRVSGQNINRTLSDIIAELQANMVRGQVDYDVLQVEWICMAVSERRDKYTLIMRAMRPIFHHFVMQYGDGAILSVETVIIGDSEIGYGEKGAPALRGVMNVVVQTEQMVQIGRDDTGTWETLDQSYTAD